MSSIFHEVKNYAILLESVKPFGGSGTVTTEWNWEISIYKLGTGIFKAKASEESKGKRIPWFVINLDDENEALKSILNDLQLHMNQS
ncbi:hypothetical protein [Cohnella herbarum]|uniref:Uncharacterized protein n=1 Tax=Cohnella herbarum TaxID=2728023 RepID=A0A7Z2ZPL8_9BACL|nr:hypothetical protein [Cohnella herbarum]QJD87606.1 hypothetical protein HH215_33440 [Cohnella herbarum]